jgi:hypothetical protein
LFGQQSTYHPSLSNGPSLLPADAFLKRARDGEFRPPGIEDAHAYPNDSMDAGQHRVHHSTKCAYFYNITKAGETNPTQHRSEVAKGELAFACRDAAITGYKDAVLCLKEVNHLLASHDAYSPSKLDGIGAAPITGSVAHGSRVFEAFPFLGVVVQDTAEAQKNKARRFDSRGGSYHVGPKPITICVEGECEMASLHVDDCKNSGATLYLVARLVPSKLKPGFLGDRPEKTNLEFDASYFGRPGAYYIGPDEEKKIGVGGGGPTRHVPILKDMIWQIFPFTETLTTAEAGLSHGDAITDDDMHDGQTLLRGAIFSAAFSGSLKVRGPVGADPDGHWEAGIVRLGSTLFAAPCSYPSRARSAALGYLSACTLLAEGTSVGLPTATANLPRPTIAIHKNGCRQVLFAI